MWQVEGPGRATCQFKNAPQGSETEMRELLVGTEEKSISFSRGHWFAWRANQWFFCASLKFDCLWPPCSAHQVLRIVGLFNRQNNLGKYLVKRFFAQPWNDSICQNKKEYASCDSHQKMAVCRNWNLILPLSPIMIALKFLNEKVVTMLFDVWH